MRISVIIIGFFLLSGIVSAQYPGGVFHTGYPSEPVRGYFQPVMIRAPEGTQLTCVIEGRFSERLPRPFQAGLLVGCDYRLRITGIPFNPGKELFPTLTILTRTYPPQGRELDFPIIINITLEDLESALAGQYITRVIFLENPKAALPIPTGDDEQLTYDIQSGDPVQAATTQGLPVAIVRIGGRVPAQKSSDGNLAPEFCFGSPPWTLNRTIPPESIGFPAQTASTQPNALTIDPTLKSAGLAVLNWQQELRPNPWLPPHRTTAPGGRNSEYLVNGGDAAKPAYVEDNSWTVHNFGAGDTVAHFDTLEGHVIVEPSNSIHIYAPRFRAIRKVEGLALKGQVTALAVGQGRQVLSQSGETLQTSFTEQESGVRYARKQEQINSIDGQRRSTEVDTTQTLVGYDNIQVVDANRLLQRTFGFHGELRAQLDRGAMNARAWQSDEGTSVHINELEPMSLSGIDGAAVYFHVEDKQSRASMLRLIKVASKEWAQPGEIIEFTLRFDNIGNRLIGNVTILDNLTSRLEFLPDTAISSLESGFDSRMNAEGSQTLRFEITDPLAPGDFGVIRFQCRVR